MLCGQAVVNIVPGVVRVGIRELRKLDVNYVGDDPLIFNITTFTFNIT